MKNLGILQGRLLKPINGLIQEFPFVEWEKEIPLMESLGFEHFEWIINNNYFRSNPFFYCDLSDLRISSVGLDNITGASYQQVQHILYKVLPKVISHDIHRITFPILEESNIDDDGKRAHFIKILQDCEYYSIMQNGITFSIETDCTIEHLKEVLDKLPHAKVTYDTGNTNVAGIDHTDFIEAFHDRIDNVHIKDKDSKSLQNVPLGTGDTPFEEIFQALGERAYDGLWTLQTSRSYTGYEYERAVTDKIFVEELHDKHFGENLK